MPRIKKGELPTSRGVPLEEGKTQEKKVLKVKLDPIQIIKRISKSIMKMCNQKEGYRQIKLKLM